MQSSSKEGAQASENRESQLIGQNRADESSEKRQNLTSGVDLAKRREEQHAKGGDLLMKVERFPCHKGMPWGLELDADTLSLKKIAKGSVANVFQGTLQRAVGMELDSINGRVVRNLDQVERQLEKGDIMWFSFCYASDPPPATPSPQKEPGTDNLRIA